MSFKDMLERDIHGVFLNTDEFAEHRTVLYDGGRYKDIPIVLTQIKEKDKLSGDSNAKFENRAEGLISSTVMMYASAADLGGNLPERGTYISLGNGTALGKEYFDRYLIVTSALEMGMCVLELEAVSE